MTLKIKIEFDEIVAAFEHSDVDHHYFIDTKENIIVYVNEAIESDAKEKIEKAEANGYKYIRIPAKLPEEDFLDMELFIYGLQEKDFDLSEKLYEAIHTSKPFRDFKELLTDYPDVREQWLTYKNKTVRNKAIDWLCEKGIELENQELKVEVNEVKKEEIENLPEDVKGFLPAMCATCNNEEGLEPLFFSVNLPPENKLVESETKRIMKEKYGISIYGNWTGGERELLTAAKCTKCGSEDVIWDY